MLLSLKDVFKSFYNESGRNYRDVLTGLNLNILKGEKIAITGPSGSGKSTLLNLISALDFPDKGEILYKDRLLSGLKKSDLNKFRNQEIGFIFQFHHLLPQFSLLENVLIPTLPFKNNTNNHFERAEKLMNQTGIWDLRHQKPGELSGGECQRAAVVRAFINNPELILADEPTGALDEKNTLGIIQLLIDFNKTEGTTLVIVTHSAVLAEKMDKQFMLKNGKLG